MYEKLRPVFSFYSIIVYVINCLRKQPAAGSNWSMIDWVLCYLSLPRNLSLDNSIIYWIFLFCQALNKFSSFSGTFRFAEVRLLLMEFLFNNFLWILKELHASHYTISYSKHTLLDVCPKARDFLQPSGFFGTSRIKWMSYCRANLFYINNGIPPSFTAENIN